MIFTTDIHLKFRSNTLTGVKAQIQAEHIVRLLENFYQDLAVKIIIL